MKMETPSQTRYPTVRMKVNQARPKPASYTNVSREFFRDKDRAATNITTPKLSSRISREDQHEQGEHELGDTEDEMPQRLGRDVGPVVGVLAAGPGVVGVVDHLGVEREGKRDQVSRRHTAEALWDLDIQIWWLSRGLKQSTKEKQG